MEMYLIGCIQTNPERELSTLLANIFYHSYGNGKRQGQTIQRLLTE